MLSARGQTSHAPLMPCISESHPGDSQPVKMRSEKTKEAMGNAMRRRLAEAAEVASRGRTEGQRLTSRHDGMATEAK